MVQLLWAAVWRFCKRLDMELPYDLAIPSTPRYRPKRNENIGPHKIVSMSVHSSISHKSQKWKQPRSPSAMTG